MTVFSAYGWPIYMEQAGSGKNNVLVELSDCHKLYR